MKNFSSKAFYNKVLINIKDNIYKDNNKIYKFDSYTYNKGVYNLYFNQIDSNRYKIIQLYCQHKNNFANTIDLINKCFNEV